jgi:hypothetical protein
MGSGAPWQPRSENRATLLHRGIESVLSLCIEIDDRSSDSFENIGRDNSRLLTS